jgi:hypothetical protein
MVEFEYIDKSNYFRALLILIGKDNIISENERKNILEIGKNLGFEKKFCEEAVNDFLYNRFVDLSPPKFSKNEIAQLFIKDAINIAFSDNELFVGELEWIKMIAEKNELNSTWLDQEILKYGNLINKENFEQKSFISEKKLD